MDSRDANENSVLSFSVLVFSITSYRITSIDKFTRVNTDLLKIKTDKPTIFTYFPGSLAIGV